MSGALRQSAASAVAALLLASALPAALATPDSLAQECPSETAYPLPADAPLATLQQQAGEQLARLGLRVGWQAAEAQTFADQAGDRQRLRRLLAVLLPALGRYPAGLLAELGVQQVIIVKDLQVGGQARRAMPAVERQALLYADLGGEPPCPAGVELRAHHELYHFLEHRRSGSYYPVEPGWLALNPADWQYGRGGATAYAAGFQNLGHPRPGAVSRYALYGAEEDRAELYGWAMTPGYRERLQRWQASDALLAAKLQALRALLPAPLQALYLPETR